MTSHRAAPTLETCDQEPIHIPGSIQPHGALLAVDRLGRLSHLSANAPGLLGAGFELGKTLKPELFTDNGQVSLGVYQAIAESIRRDRATKSMTCRLNGSEFDVVLHRSDTRLVCEFERRQQGADVSTFAQLAFSSLDEMRRCRSIEELVSTAVDSVRAITGFDRVMAYRFAHDESGDVIAEAKSDALDAYLGRRYPASDIPAQARRLYVLNTLRLIADVTYRPVPVISTAAETAPLDLSHGVLRSVSPIHVEYLTNMGVQASMSVSIVVAGRLWGLIACHHLAPKLVPYPVRMAVDVMAQVIAASVQSLLAQAREAAVARAALVRTEIASSIATGQEVVDALLSESAALCDTLAADEVVVCFDGTPRGSDGVDVEWAKSLCAWLDGQATNVVHVTDRAALPSWAATIAGERQFCGVLALRFDQPKRGWIVALRRERVYTIRWGGKPDKVSPHGPLGPRLTPRGSFDEWRETVRGTASPWSAVQLEIASQLMDTVARAHSSRLIELDAMRAQVWAMLGHDLRNPLQSINMANSGIERGLDTERLNSVIRKSTNRMNRLLSDVLDMSRLQHGFELTVVPRPLDLVELLKHLVDETTVAHPTFRMNVDLPGSIPMQGDAGRLAQLFSNLLSNARHHGQGETTIRVKQDGEFVTVCVSNSGAPISQEMLPTLFDPFKRVSMVNERNRTGMGLGLYIAAQVAQGHGGTLKYVPGDGIVSFVAELPLAARAEGSDGA